MSQVVPAPWRVSGGGILNPLGVENLTTIEKLESFLESTKEEEIAALIGTLLVDGAHTRVLEIYELLSAHNKISRDIAIDIYDGLLENDHSFALEALVRGVSSFSRIEEIYAVDSLESPLFLLCHTISDGHPYLEELEKHSTIFQWGFKRFILKEAVTSLIRNSIDTGVDLSVEESSEIDRIINLKDIKEISFNINLLALYKKCLGVKTREAILNPEFYVSDFFKNKTNIIIVRTKLWQQKRIDTLTS